jgi:hypothetical protein
MPISLKQIFRDFVVDGVPSSGRYKPKKSEVRSWGVWVEGLLNSVGQSGGFLYDTRALLYADLTKPANTLAWVIADPVVAFNGVYQKSGPIGSGYWVRSNDLPYSFIRATDEGAGTPNAIQATTAIPVSLSAMVILQVYETNTGSPVTISFNGEPAIAIKDYSGNDILANELKSGAIVTGIIAGDGFRLLFDKEYPYIRATNSGAGTANAIQASVASPVDYTNAGALVSFNITTTNTASPVTVSINGGAALTIKTSSGANVAIGGLVSGMQVLGSIVGTEFRLLSDQASAAVVASAEAAATAAQGYRDQAAGYAALALNNWNKKEFTGDGVTTSFDLLINPGSVNNVFATVGTTPQNDFSLAGTVVTFSEAPPNGAKVVLKFGGSITVGTPADGSISTAKIAGNAVDLTKLLDIATLTFLGRKSGGTGDPEVLTKTDLRDSFLPDGTVIDRGFASYAANSALTVALPTDDTIPQITEGTEILKVTITPKKTTSRLRARAVVIGSVNAADNWAIALFSAGGANALDAAYAPPLTANYISTLTLEWEWVPGVTTAIDVTIRAGSNPTRSLYLNGSSAGRIFGGASHCTLVVEELKA